MVLGNCIFCLLEGSYGVGTAGTRSINLVLKKRDFKLDWDVVQTNSDVNP